MDGAGGVQDGAGGRVGQCWGLVTSALIIVVVIAVGVTSGAVHGDSGGCSGWCAECVGK